METNNIEKLKSKAKKLKALADRGEGGEKETSKRMYDAFIKKHNIDDVSINPSANKRRFRVKNYDDSLILTNVILSINPFTKLIQNELSLECELDLEDFNETKQKFGHFVKLYRIDKELLNMAFFSKHQKFFTPDEDVKKKWRESNTENEELRKAREKASKMDIEANKNPKEEPKTQAELDKIKKDSQIQLLNLSRMTKLQDILLEGRYVKNNKSLEEKK